MNERTFKVNLAGITELDCFKEASRDELKILLAIASENTVSTEELAKKLGVSEARVKSCITLFSESGVLGECDDGI